MIDLASLVGAPYRIGAEGPDEFDCYGLVRFVLRERHGIELPTWEREDGSLMAVRRLFRDRASDASVGFHETSEPDDGDVILMGTRDRAAHCGIAVRAGTMLGCLHALSTSGVVFEPVTALGAQMSWLSFWRRSP